MAYQSLCARFSSSATAIGAVSGSVGSMLALDHALYAPGLAMSATSVLFGAGWGLFGWLAAAIAESNVKSTLYARKVGLTNGSRIVQRAELAAYGIALVFGLAVKAGINEGLEGTRLNSSRPAAPEALSVPAIPAPAALPAVPAKAMAEPKPF
jgi:hypothetical protein